MVRRLMIIAVLVAAFTAPSAMAGPGNANQTAKAGYGGLGKIQAVLGSKAKTTKKSVAAPKVASTSPTVAQSGALPFTGTDLGLLVLGGALLMVIGFGVRRTSRDGG